MKILFCVTKPVVVPYKIGHTGDTSEEKVLYSRKIAFFNEDNLTISNSFSEIWNMKSREKHFSNVFSQVLKIGLPYKNLLRVNKM
jgi:hypothetical protein